MKLYQLAEIIRSKNSKAFTLILDVVFRKREIYTLVKDSGIINKALISELYQVKANDVMITWFDDGLAFKVTMPRPVPQGDAGDGDILGGQQYGPLLDIEIPNK